MTVGARVAPAHPTAPTASSTREGPHRTSNLWRASFAIAFATVVIAAGATWLEVFDRLRAPDPVPARGTPAAIVWSERVFRSEAELAAWLRSRDINYARWVRKHPAAVSILRSRDRPAAEAAGRTNPPKQPKAAAQGPGQRPNAGPRIGTLSLVAIGIAALALLLALGVAAVSSVSLAPIAELGGRVRSRAKALSVPGRLRTVRFPGWSGLVPRAVLARAGGGLSPADRVVVAPARVTAPRASRTSPRVTTAPPEAPPSKDAETTVAELRQVEARLAELEQALLATVAEPDGATEAPEAKPRTRPARKQAPPKQAPAKPKPRTRSVRAKQPQPPADGSVPAAVEDVAPPPPRRRAASAAPLRSAPAAQPVAPAPAAVAEPAAPPACEIRWSRGPISSQFCAVARRDDGREVTIRFSPFFRWRESGPPPETPDAAIALRSLVESLEREGWTVAGRGADWFAVHMLPPDSRF